MARKKKTKLFGREKSLSNKQANPPEKNNGTTIKWRLIRAVPFLALAFAIVFYFNRAGLLAQFETAVLDTQMRLDAPSKESPVVIVNIDQEDFDGLFEGRTRPLNPPKLHALIIAVHKGNPCVIGVDIDTSFPEFRNFQISKEWSNIVWAREVEEIPADINQKPIPMEVLGGKENFNGNSGIPFLIDDASGVTRRYKRLIETIDRNLPSFAWAVFRESEERRCAGIDFPELPLATTAPLLIKYSRGAEGVGRNKFSASHIIRLAQSPDWQNNDLIKDKIVLIGGTYLGDDKHRTPLGEMPGVDIIANVVETELRGGGIEPPRFFIVALLALFDALFLVGLFQIVKSWWKAFCYSILAIVVLSPICSLLTYHSLAQSPLFALIMFGVLLAELFDKIKDRYYKKEIEEIYSQISKPFRKRDSK